MKSLIEYYKNELAKLDLAKEYFVDMVPSISASISRSLNDPDTKQLMQSVAFFAANIQHSIDEQENEYLQSMGEVLSPYLALPIPAINILSLNPKPSQKATILIEKGAIVDSDVVAEGHNGFPVKCRFSSAWPIWLTPIELQDAYLEKNTESDGDTLVLDMKRYAQIDPECTQVSLYLNMRFDTAVILMQALTHELAEIIIFDNEQSVSLCSSVISISGLVEGQSILQERFCDSVQILLSEYFLFPAKMLFFTIKAEVFSQFAEADTYQVKLRFKTKLNLALQIKKENIVFNVFPVINSFPVYLPPKKISSLVSELALDAYYEELQGAQKLCIIEVLDVIVYFPNTETSIVYNNINSHIGISSKKRASFKINRKFDPILNTMSNTLFLEHPRDFKEEGVLRIKVLVSNGQYAEKVNANELCELKTGFPGSVQGTNLIASSASASTNRCDINSWQIISDQHLKFSDLRCSQDLQTYLKRFIPGQLLNSHPQQLNIRRIEGIYHFSTELVDQISMGISYRGTKYRLALSNGNYSSTSDMLMFADIIYTLISYHLPVNQYCSLIVIDASTEEELRCLSNSPVSN